MQMKTITDVQIDLYGDTQYYAASAKQGDKKSRYLRIQLMSNGNEFQIPDDAILIANIKKPDGKFCYNECTKLDNRVIVQLTNQALAAAGTAYCDIEMRSQNGELILSSAAFTIEIESSMRNENAIESSNEMTFIDRKFEIIEKIRQEVEKTYADFAEEKEEIDNHLADKENPHETDKVQIGLSNVDNTADIDKPVSTAQQAAMDDLYQQLTAYTLQKIADLIDGAPEDLDTLKEVHDAIEANREIMDALNEAIGKKASAAEFDSHVKDTTKHITPAERTSWTGKLAPTGDASDVTATFSQASSRANLTSKEKLSVSLGKIMKWLADLANGAASTLLGANLTANRALVADGNGKVAASSVTATELGYLAGVKSKVQDQLNELNTGITKVSDLVGGHTVGFTTQHYTGTTTMTALLKNLTAPIMCLLSTENVSDKPTGKYGTIVIFKYSASRAGAICFCTDGSLFVNNWNASTSAVTGWRGK